MLGEAAKVPLGVKSLVGIGSGSRVLPQGGQNQESVGRGREFLRRMWSLNEAKQQGLIPTVPSSERLSMSYRVEKNGLGTHCVLGIN